MIENGVFTVIDDPRLGRLRTVDSPLTLRGERKRSPTRAPEIGEHTRDVLRSLGYSDERIRSLERQGAVRTDGSAPA